MTRLTKKDKEVRLLQPLSPFDVLVEVSPVFILVACFLIAFNLFDPLNRFDDFQRFVMAGFAYFTALPIIDYYKTRILPLFGYSFNKYGTLTKVD